MSRFFWFRSALLAHWSPLLGSVATSAGEPAGIRYDQIPEAAYAVVAEVRAKAGKEAELRAIALTLVAQVRAEPNNLLYFLHEDREPPGHFVFYEIFVTTGGFRGAQRHTSRAGLVPEIARTGRGRREGGAAADPR